MSKLDLYNGLKTDLMSIDSIKHVSLWNNNLENERQEISFLYPAVFIEFQPSEYKEKGANASFQQYEQPIRLHICFENYKDEDAEILTLVNDVWQKIQTKQYSTFGKLLRRGEEISTDHDNVQDYIQDYITLGNDTLYCPSYGLVPPNTLDPVTDAEKVAPNEI